MSKDRLPPRDLMALYRTRWEIEIRFRAWKGSLKLNQTFCRKRNKHHLESLIYASLIHQVLAMTAGTKIATVYGHERLSLEKLGNSLSSLLQRLPDFDLETPLIFHKRHVLREHRKRISYKAKGLEALT